MLSLWGEMVLMVGTPIILVPVAWRVNHLAKQQLQNKDLP
ncbi:hypothetical protein Acife_3094 [Acidithiobacillus ferrivorans SS3]|jgi:hypothetical protein|uniref:Uncharacterized protein n=1 Tax=Acidithiobacillus ferrivorans SS3 TaxID=743299 RepID=G0JL51_9PROT|nr:hypothetical protein Acife_3094 [Acidithiobacillus ferrivorans SS3]